MDGTLHPAGVRERGSIMATWIIFGLLILAMGLAVRYTVRKAKKGECVGCSGCKGGHGCHCHDR